MFGSKTKILVVDDMFAMRVRISNQIKAMGLVNVTQAENGKIALDLIEKEFSAGTPFELVVSDWNMPEMSGLELVTKLRSNPIYAKLPFLMVTAEGEKSQVVTAIKAGVSDYVVKPVDAEALKVKLFNVWKKVNPTAA